MKVLLVGINAKFVHTNLALTYLESASPFPIQTMEFTINEQENDILANIAREEYDIVGFSCYIWNWSLILRLTENLKKIHPKTKILLGGPEVSFECPEIMNSYPWIDLMIYGPGELPWSTLLKDFPDYKKVPALVWRDGSEVTVNPALPDDWSERKSVFLPVINKDYQGKNLYYETSRGCPYRCSYCLSGEDKLRFLPLDRVKEELTAISKTGAKQIKFVDRTFNCNSKRAVKIWQYILGLEEKADNYHFEISAGMLDEKQLEVLKKVPEGFFNLEIGVQTVHENVLAKVYRKSTIEKDFYWIKRILEETKVHVHLDLIIGLPEETYQDFQRSLNEVVSLKPHKLQIGFLKLLRGSKIREEAGIYDYKFRSYPPYEVLSNKFISYLEISFLHKLEHIFDKYYNSERFMYILKYLELNNDESAFDFYAGLTEYWIENKYFDRSIGLEECYAILADFIALKYPDLKQEALDVLRFDYLSHKNKGNLPAWCGKVYSKEDKNRHRILLEENDSWQDRLKGLASLSWKDQLQRSHSDHFMINPLNDFKKEDCCILFYYGQKSEYIVLK